MSATTPQPKDALWAQLENYLKQHYEPADSIADSMHMSTRAIWEALLRLHPDLPISEGELAVWLVEHGFRFADAGNLKFVWLIKKV